VRDEPDAAARAAHSGRAPAPGHGRRLDRCPELGPDADRGKRGSIGKRDAQAGRFDAIASRGLAGRRGGSGEIFVLVQVARVGRAIRQARGREQPREVVAKGTGSGERDQVRAALCPPGARGSAPEHRQHGGGEHDRERRSKGQRQGLAAVGRRRRRAPEQAPRQSHDAARASAAGLQPGEGSP
jgi:hypothetical protein